MDDEEYGAGAEQLHDWMTRAAALARASPASTFRLLADGIAGEQQRLVEAAAAGAGRQ